MVGRIRISAVSIVPIETPEDVTGFPEGYHKIDWMSEEWKELLAYAIKEAEKKNIEVHISIGQGWPLGDITKKYPSEIVITDTITVNGPCNYKGNVWNLFTLKGQYLMRNRSAHLIDSSVFALRLLPANPKEFTIGKEYKDRLDEQGNFSISVPDGKYKIYISIWQKGYSCTKHNPDNHLTLNYIQKDAVRETMDSAFKNYISIPGSKKLKSLYHDSWELDELNWGSDFHKEFMKRRGYDILTYLPFVSNFYLENPEPETPFYDTVQYVRNDYIKTVCELFEERTLKVLSEWNKQHGYAFRNQGYGREQHPLDANLYLDIPEGESWFRGDDIEISMINRYVATAAHLNNIRKITSETNTNVNNIYRVNLPEIKRLTDLNYISGMTQVFLHGYNYSPQPVEAPGWVRYGTFFSEHNPFWTYMPVYTKYIQRVSSVIQNAEPKANIAIYSPDHDILKKQSREFKPFPEKINPWYIYELWKTIHNCGYNSHYTSDKVIPKIRTRKIWIYEDLRFT